VTTPLVRLQTAMFEARGRTLPPEMSQAAPRLKLRCSTCALSLGDVYATTVGGLLWWDQPRARVFGDAEKSPESMRRETLHHVFMVDQIGDDLEHHCPKDGWRSLPTAARLQALLYDPPSDGVVPLYPAPNAVL
jgi:hypothetical protein